MSEDRGDWVVDTEGNLTPPDGDGLKPPTDEFGRDDPASLERERRRREREARRGKSRKAKTAPNAEQAPSAERPPRAEQAAAPPKAPRRKRARKAEAPASAPAAVPVAASVEAPRRNVSEPSAAQGPVGDKRDPARMNLRERFGRDGGDPGPPRPRGAYWRRRLLALVLVLVGLLVAWFLVAFFQPPPFDPGDGSGEAIVTVPEGATGSDVADLLSSNDVVSNATLFEWRLKLSGDSDKILPGRYVLAHNMSYGSAIDRLTSSGGQINVTIPEGEDRTQIAATVKDLGLSGDYLAASKSFKGFDPNKYGANNPKSLEGFLFPATYQLNPGASVDQLVSKQLQGFQQNFAGVDMSYAKSKNLTVYDVLTIASMIDKEVQIPSERPLVAAVIYNRLSQGMPLGIDATTRFEFHNYTGDITRSQLQSPSPYNTRINAGLPPTPIGNPGLAAIKAAARPAKVNYVFYVLNGDNSGHHCFTASSSEFDTLVAASTSGHATPNCRS